MSPLLYIREYVLFCRDLYLLSAPLIYFQWLIERHGDQAAYTIRNADNKFYTCAREGKVVSIVLTF